MPRLNKTLRTALALGRFARHYNLFIEDVVELVALALAAFRTGEAACNYPNRDEANEVAHRRFRAKAEQLGFGVEFNGLWPTLTRDGQDISLPSDDN